MAKPDQVLVIDPPSELRFKGPFTSQVTSFLKLHNPIDKKVYFKIKTTAPKKYCVRPNSGSLDPKETVDVAVSLQPFDYDPAEKNKHKFMVQSVIDDEDVREENVWLNVRPQDSMDSKLKCVFEMPQDDDGANDEPAGGDETRKRMTEVKAASKPQPADSTYLDAAKEVKTLRMEESIMRQQNLALKEDILRLQREIASAPQRTAPVALQENPQARSAFDVVIAIIIGLVGIIIGKLFL